MRTGSICPRCGCELDHGGDQRSEPPRLSVEALLDEIEQLRATVARLRGSGFTAVVAPVPTIPLVPEHP